MKCYYIKSLDTLDFHAGSKARRDCEKIFQDLSLEEIKIKNKSLEKRKLNKIYNIIRNIKIYIRCYKNLKRRDLIFYQFPYSSSSERVLLKILQLKKCRIIAIIHDLEGIRQKSNKKLQRESSYLNRSYKIISHNNKMTDILQKDYKIISQIKELFIFDYLINKKNNKEENLNVPSRRVCYAGNLDYNKSSFIYKLNELKDINFNVYGVNYQEEKNKNSFQYCGAFHPDIIHTKLQGDFGLIWDGNSLKNCEGMCGEYLKYNNPHKFSLYIAAGLPVITWDKAAISSYIIENKLGVVISSLNELKGILDNVSKEDYEVMKSNVIKLREKIINGEVLKRLLVEIIEEEENEK